MDDAKTGKQRTASALWLAALVLIIALYLFLIRRFSVDVPLSDDVLLLWRLIKHETNPSGDYLPMLWHQHNEHRLVLLTGLSATYHQLFGPINFRYMALCGNIVLVGAFFMIVKGILSGGNTENNNEKSKNQFFLQLPQLPIYVIAALIFFTMRYWDTAFWPMASMSGFPALFFGLCAVFFITQNKLVIGFISAILSLFSQGNGLFAFAACAIVLLQQKKYRTFAIWSILSLLFFVAYFHGYTKPGHHGALASVIADPLGFIVFSLILLGNILPWQNETSIGFPITLGIVISGIVIYTFVRYRNDRSPLIGYLTFCLLSLLAVSAGRMSFGLEYALNVTRYSLISVCIVTVLAVFYLNEYRDTKILKKPLLFLIVLGALSVYLLNNYFAFPAYKNHYKAARNYGQCSDGCVYGIPLFDPVLIQNILSQAAKLNLYRIKTPPEDCRACEVLSKLIVFKAPEKPYNEVENIDGYLDRVQIENEKELVVTAWGLGRKEDLIGLSVFISSPVVPEKNEIRQIPRSDVDPIVKAEYVATGFISRLYFADAQEAEQAAASLCVATKVENDYFLLGGLPSSCYAMYFKEDL